MVLGMPEGSKEEAKESLAGRAKGGLLFMGGFVILLYIIEILNTLMRHGLNSTFGLRSRSMDGVLDILTFPLLHANLNHLLSNTCR
jgi:membrane associated rhomboid family serine protease